MDDDDGRLEATEGVLAELLMKLTLTLLEEDSDRVVVAPGEELETKVEGAVGLGNEVVL